MLGMDATTFAAGAFILNAIGFLLCEHDLIN